MSLIEEKYFTEYGQTLLLIAKIVNAHHRHLFQNLHLHLFQQALPKIEIP